MIGYTLQSSYISHTSEVIYAVKSSEKVISHVLQLGRYDGTLQAPAKYLPLGPVCPHNLLQELGTNHSAAADSHFGRTP